MISEENIDLLLTFGTNILIFLGLLSIGAVFGYIAENRHFKSIAQREQELQGIKTFNQKKYPTVPAG